MRAMRFFAVFQHLPGFAGVSMEVDPPATVLHPRPAKMADVRGIYKVVGLSREDAEALNVCLHSIFVRLC